MNAHCSVSFSSYRVRSVPAVYWRSLELAQEKQRLPNKDDVQLEHEVKFVEPEAHSFFTRLICEKVVV